MKTTVIAVFFLSILLCGAVPAFAQADHSELVDLIEAVVSPEGCVPPSHFIAEDRALKSKLEVRATLALDEGNTFEEFLAILKEKYGIQAIVDPRGAGALGITLSSPVVREQFRLENVPLRRILRSVLQEQDLTYVIDEGFLQITSEDEAWKFAKVRVYPVADLVSDPNTELGIAFSELMDVIEITIAPDSWDEGGDMIDFHPSLCIVVRQTDEVHDQIEHLLAELRAKRVEPDKKISGTKTVAPTKRTPHRRFGTWRRR